MAELSARALKEWVGKTPDVAIPLRVKLRILTRQDSRCFVCAGKFGPKLKPHFDHRPALVNGGENRESTINAVCPACHEPLTKADVAEKSKVADTRAKHLGLKKSKHPMAGSKGSPWKRKLDGSWVRREK